MANKKIINKKKICIISFSTIGRDFRVQREIEMARTSFEVTVIGYGAWEPFDNVKYIQLSETRRTKGYLLCLLIKLLLGYFFHDFYNAAYWGKSEYKQAVSIIKNGKFDLVHANDWAALPVAAEAAAHIKTKVLFDAHEYYPYQINQDIFSTILLKPYREYILRKFQNVFDAMVDASTEFSRLYKENFGWDSTTILNAPYYEKNTFKPVDPRQIRIIYHGLAVPNRQQEELINMIKLADNRYHLFMMLVPGINARYYSWLKSYGQKKAPNRVTFLDPVQPEEVVETIKQFDLGIPYLKSKQLNQFYAQQNKFFEYMMAGLGVITTPQKGLAGIINKYQVGCVAESQSAQALADLLNSLDDKEINMFKRNSIKAAKTFNAKNEMKKLERVYINLT